MSEQEESIESVELDGLEVWLTRSSIDGVFVVQIVVQPDKDRDENGKPKVRVYLNEVTLSENPPLGRPLR